jgi:cell division protein FtsL
MSAMATLSSSEDEFSFGPNERVSLTAADFEESGTDSDFAESSSSSEEENPYLAAIASPGTRARRESPVAASPPLRPLASSPSRSPREELRSTSGGDSDERDSDDDVDADVSTLKKLTRGARSSGDAGIKPAGLGARVRANSQGTYRAPNDEPEDVFSQHASPAPEPARVAPPKATAFRAVDRDVFAEKEEKKPTATFARGGGDDDDDDRSALERRVDSLERALASLAATARTLATAKDDAEVRLVRAEARVGELEARVADFTTGSGNPHPVDVERTRPIDPRSVPVEIDGDSIAAIERVVEEATRAAMRSADAKRVVEAAAAAAAAKEIAAARADLEAAVAAAAAKEIAAARADLERSALASVTEAFASVDVSRFASCESLTTHRDEVKRLIESHGARLETRVAETERASKESLERTLHERIESRLATLADAAATTSVARVVATHETRLLVSARQATKTVEAALEKNLFLLEENTKSHADRVRRATKRAAAVEAIVTETESRARDAETVSRRAADLVAAAEDASRRVERIESAVADVVDAIAEQLSAFKSESKQREEKCVQHAERAERAAEEAIRKTDAATRFETRDSDLDRASRLRLATRSPRESLAFADENETAENAFATPARVSSARAADSRARAEATARRLAASVEAMSGFSGEEEKGDPTSTRPNAHNISPASRSPSTPSSRASAALFSATKQKRSNLEEAVSNLETLSVSPAVTVRSPRARKREWVA